MSAKLMGQVFDLDLPRPEAWVLMALVDHADHDGTRIFPSIGYVAWKTGYKRRRVQDIIKRLREGGVLVLVAAARDHHPCEYRADFSKAPLKPERGANCAPRSRGRGATADAPRGVHSRADRGATATAPKPSVESSREPSDDHRAVLNVGQEQRRNDDVAGEVDTPEGLIAAYNDLCPDLPRVRGNRRRRAEKALEARPLSYWREVFTKAATSDFLNGKNGRAWKADFAWLLGDRDGVPNAEGVLDGKYHNGSGPPRSRPAASKYRDFPVTNEADR